jgi:O-antigen ligase
VAPVVPPQNLALLAREFAGGLPLPEDPRARPYEVVMEQPLVGAGFGRESMKKAYPDLVPADPPMSLMWHPHNVLLNYGVAMGVPGVVVLLLLLTGFAVTYGQQLRSANEQDRLIAAAGIILITGVVVRNMTNDLFLRDGALLFWALNGALLGYLMRQRKT